MIMIPSVCYRTKDGNTYLAYYSYAKTIEELEAEAARINIEKPERLWNGQPAKCDERIYFAKLNGEMY